MSFNPGDVVQLKSGGQKMTVDREDIDPIGAMDENRVRKYLCTWFDKSTLCTGTFPETHLVAPESPGKVFCSVGSRMPRRR